MARPRLVERSSQNYAECAQFCESELSRLATMYKDETSEMKRRLIRDSIDHHIRRYQGYSIKGNFGSHYTVVGVTGSTIFEHVIPASTARDMVLDGSFTPAQALNIPTCTISKLDDDILRRAGMVSSTPDTRYFFKRYSVLNIQIQTHTGTNIDPSTWTLEDHFALFK